MASSRCWHSSWSPRVTNGLFGYSPEVPGTEQAKDQMEGPLSSSPSSASSSSTTTASTPSPCHSSHPCPGPAYSTEFLDIPWNDVLFPFVLVHLSWRDLFRMRRVSSEMRAMINEYFKSVSVIDLKSLSQRFSSSAFDIITCETRNVRVLNLSGCKWLTNDQLLPLIERNPNLVVLDISGCFEVSNVCLQRLAIRCRGLRTLRLKDCHWVATVSIVCIAMNCTLLEDLDLTSCWEISDEAAVELINRCTGLTSLSLSKIYGITDQTLLTMALHSKKLQVLNVSGCWRITDYGIRMLGEYCAHLKQLVVGDCRDVTDESLTCLRSRNVQVDVPSYSRPRINLFLRGLDILRLQI